MRYKLLIPKNVSKQNLKAAIIDSDRKNQFNYKKSLRQPMIIEFYLMHSHAISWPPGVSALDVSAWFQVGLTPS